MRWVSSTDCFKCALAHLESQISDLNRLIRMYQYWAHQMYPRHTFNDTIERVEKLTHSRRMLVRLCISYRSRLLGLTTLMYRSLWVDGTTKPEEYRGTRRLLRNPLTSTPTEKMVKWNIQPDKPLISPHDRHPPLQSGLRTQMTTFTWTVPERNPLERKELGMSSILRWRCGMIPPSPLAPRPALPTRLIPLTR